MTKQIEKRLSKYPLYSQDGKGEEAIAICKFFNPMGSLTWYVTEGEKHEDGDWTFFGLVKSIHGEEFDYFTLRELESVRLPFGLRIERDIYFKPTELKTAR